MQVPHIGPKQSQDEAPKPHKQLEQQQLQQCWAKQEEEEESICGGVHEGLSESIKRSYKKYGVQVHFKRGLTIKNLLMAPKNKDHILMKSGVMHKDKCDRVECDEEYIGESARTFAERFKEHQKAPSPIYHHSNI